MRHKRAEAASCIYCNPCTLACVGFTRRCQAALLESQRVYLRLETPCLVAIPFKLKLGKMQEQKVLFLYETFRME
eukprot:scaffold44035_cov146-Skeletonema_marinoi.AAC.2